MHRGGRCACGGVVAGDETASRGEAPAPQLFTRTCSARVFFALPDWNSLRDRRCRWQTSCDMSRAVRALRTRQLTSHPAGLESSRHSHGISSRCFSGVASLFKEHLRNAPTQSLIESTNYSPESFGKEFIECCWCNFILTK